MNVMAAAPQNETGELHVLAETNKITAVCLKGEFDVANAPQILAEGERLLADDKEVIVDLSDATFIDSSVIEALFRLAAVGRRNGRAVVLQLGTAAIVERVIGIMNVERVLPRVSTRVQALDTIREQRAAG